MNLFGPLCHRQVVVAHSCLTGEKSTVDTRQNDGTFHPWKTDDTVLMVDGLTGSHKRGDMTALSARQVKVPNAHRAVAATNNGEQVCVQGAHGAHCRPPAEWAQPGRRRPVDNWHIRQPVASRTHRSVTHVLTQNCHPSPETSRPGSPSIVSKSETKEPNHFSPSHANRGIMRFYQAHSVLVAAFVTDLDTPHRSKALCTSGTAWEVAFAGVTTATLTQIRTGRPMSPRRPALLADRHSFVGLTRHRATRWPDRVGDHAPTTWLHEH